MVCGAIKSRLFIWDICERSGTVTLALLYELGVVLSVCPTNVKLSIAQNTFASKLFPTFACFIFSGLWSWDTVLWALSSGGSQWETEGPAGSAHRCGQEGHTQPHGQHQQVHLLAVPLAFLWILQKVPHVPVQALCQWSQPTAYWEVQTVLIYNSIFIIAVYDGTTCSAHILI